MSKIENITGHVGMANIDPTYNPMPVEVEKPVKDESPVLSAVFAVDSTGHPRSDALVYLSQDTSPEVRDYIVRNLLVGNNPDTRSYGDSGAVIDSMRQFGESEEDYSSRLVSIATEALKDGSQK